MNSRAKNTIRRNFRIGTPHDTAVKRISDHLKIEHTGYNSSQNAVIRRMIEHCTMCDVFLASVSMDRNLFADLQFD